MPEHGWNTAKANAKDHGGVYVGEGEGEGEGGPVAVGFTVGCARAEGGDNGGRT